MATGGSPRRREESAATPARFGRAGLGRVGRVLEPFSVPSRSEFIRQAVLGKLDELETTGITEIREVPIEEAVKLIHRYLQRNPGTHYVSEFVERLGLEPKIAFAAAQKLIDKGRARLGRD